MWVIEMNRIGRFLSGEVRVRVRGSQGGGVRVRVLEVNSTVHLMGNTLP
jgi:hypothetical protein